MEVYMGIEDIICVGLGVLWWCAIRSLFKDRIDFISTDLTAVPQRTPHMNRTSILYPENAIIDVYWEDVTEEFSRGVKTHHLVNLMVFVLVALYFLSYWIANIIVILISIIT